MVKVYFFSFLLIYFPIIFAGIQADDVFIDTLETGLVYEHVIDDSLSIHILKIDLQNHDFVFEAVKAGDSLKGREKASSMLLRQNDSLYQPVAAINGDFFMISESGETENNMVSNGVFVKGVDTTDSIYDMFNNIHSQFGITKNNKPFIDRFFYDGELVADNKSYGIKRVNGRTEDSSITIYNQYYGFYNSVNNENIFNVSCSILNNKNSDTLICVVDGLNKKIASRIKPNKLIIAINENYKKLIQSIQPDDTLFIINKLNPDYPVYNLLGGWPALVKDGKNIAFLADSLEGTFKEFAKVKHPRSGVGFSKDSTTLFWFVIDGRQESSSGMSLNEFANLMIKEKVYQGLNLDGGGSSTLVIYNKVVNNPSDEDGERKVGSALILKRKRMPD